MKSIIALLVTLLIGSSYVVINNSSEHTYAASPISFQADEPPATGNDGEDTSERGMVCRLFGYFC